MEEYNEYDYVGTNQNLRGRYEQRGCINPVYMVPNPDTLDKDNEYAALQTNTLESKKQSPSEHHTDQNTVTVADGVREKDVNKGIGGKRGCIAICILMTVVAVITLVALAIGALSLRGTSDAQIESAQASQEYTHLMEEISTLKSFINQLNLETQQNISQLDDKLSSSGYSFSISASRLSTSAFSASSSIRQLSTSASTASVSAYLNFHSASRLSSSASRLSTSLFIASSRASRNSYSVSWMSHYSVSRLSTSVSRLSRSLASCSSC